MGLMMSVLVFSIGVLEALACVEHVRQSYLPLGLGRKRRRLVLDVGSGTIRHRETRRSSEFQKDPHVFLRSIQAAVEEEGDEKESEELEAIFQSVEARHIHSSQMMNHQDPIFLTVNDIDENDSCASSEISRTSTPNTVIMNMSPVPDRESIVESPNIPSDSFSDLLGPKSDEALSNQKDIGITQVDIGQFICIHDHEYPSEAIVSNGQNIDGVLQPSETKILCIDSTICTTSNELSHNKKIEIDERIISSVNMYGVDVSSIRDNETGEETPIEGCLLNNTMLTDDNVTIKNEQQTPNNNEIDLNFPVLSKDGKDNINSKIINKNYVNFESHTALQIPIDNNELCPIISETNAQNNGSIIRDNDSEINHKTKDKSFNATNSSTAETNNTDTIEKCKILVKSQAHSGKEPLIENKGKDEICEAQLEPVVESEKHSKKDESQNSVGITNAVNADSLHIIKNNDTNNFIEYSKSEISLKQKNQPVQEILFHAAQLNESVSMKLDESEVIEEVIDGTLSNDASCHRISKETETISASEGKIAETSNDGSDVCELQVARDSQREAAKLISTRTDANNEFNKIIDLEIVNQDRDINKETCNLIEVNNFNSLDSMRVCIDDNSNILKEISPDPKERKTKPENDQGNQKNMVPETAEYEVMEQALIDTENANGTNLSKDLMKGTQQELASVGIVPNDSRSIKDGKEDVYLRNDVLEDKVSEEKTELNKIQTKETSTNISEEVVNIKEEFGSGKVEPAIKSEVDIGTAHPLNETEPSKNQNQDELIFRRNATTNEDAAKKVHPASQQPTKQKSKTVSNEEITSKDLLDVKESLKPLPQKGQASDKEGKPSDGKAAKKDKGVLAKQETLNVSPFPDDVTVMVGDLPSQNQFTAVEDITSPDKAFWVRELKG